MMFPKKYQSIAVALLLIFMALVMITYNIKLFSHTGFLRKFVLEAATPLVILKN